MRILLSGIGGWGRRLTVVARDLGHEVVGYHPAAGRLFENVLWTSQWESGLAQCDAVMIASPTPEHYAQAAEAVLAGRPVFVEKPLVSTWGQAQDLAVLLRERRTPFMVGHKMRRYAAARELHRAIEAGEFGSLIRVEMACWSHDGAFGWAPGAWRGDAERHREGPLQTLGSHGIDLVHAWLGPIERVYATLDRRAAVFPAPDSATALLTTARGVPVLMTASYVQRPAHTEIRVVGSAQTAVWDGGDRLLYLGLGNRIPDHAQIDPVLEELTEWVDAVERGDPIETGFAEGASVVAVLEACRRSATERRAVEMDEIDGYRHVAPRRL